MRCQSCHNTLFSLADLQLFVSSTQRFQKCKYLRQLRSKLDLQGAGTGSQVDSLLVQLSPIVDKTPRTVSCLKPSQHLLAAEVEQVGVPDGGGLPPPPLGLGRAVAVKAKAKMVKMVDECILED